MKISTSAAIYHISPTAAWLKAKKPEVEVDNSFLSTFVVLVLASVVF
jgi:hypothetical protein